MGKDYTECMKKYFSVFSPYLLLVQEVRKYQEIYDSTYFFSHI